MGVREGVWTHCDQDRGLLSSNVYIEFSSALASCSFTIYNLRLAQGFLTFISTEALRQTSIRQGDSAEGVLGV